MTRIFYYVFSTGFYQCPIPGGAVGQNMYNPFQSNSTKGNNIR